MMTALCGDRGIGKTYHLAQECYRRYKAGYLIVTNFDFVYSHVNYADKSPEEFYKLLQKILIFKERGFEAFDLFPGFRHTGIFIAIDEGHLFFSADMWKRYQTDDTFQDVIRVLAQARKLDIEIYYTTQDPAKIDKNWRRYTEDWIRFRPVIYWRRKIKLPHPTKPIWKRELRHLFPLVWMEWHNLDYENPVFDYTTTADDYGYRHWSVRSTLIRRRFRRAGWMDPFPYKLYDSNEILSVNIQKKELFDFSTMIDLAVVPWTFRPEWFPFLKWIFHLKPNDATYPTRYHLPTLHLAPVPIGSTKLIHARMREATMTEQEWQDAMKMALRGRVAKLLRRPLDK